MNKKPFYNLMKPVARATERWFRKHGKEYIKNIKFVCAKCGAELPASSDAKEHVCLVPSDS